MKKKIKQFTHLTKEERDRITILHAKLYGVRKIAKELGRSPATISRELNRKEAVYYRGDYIGSQTQINVEKLWSKTHNKYREFDSDVEQYIAIALKNEWSPETIAGRLKMKFNINISYSTIYRYLKRERIDLQQYLLRHDFKRKKKKKTTNPSKSTIPNRTDISKRPQEANERISFGHFECDLVLSSRITKHALVVITDRATRKTHIKRVLIKPLNKLILK